MGAGLCGTVLDHWWREIIIRRLTEAPGWLRIIIRIRSRGDKYDIVILCIVTNTTQFKEAAKILSFKQCFALLLLIFYFVLTAKSL